MADSTKREDEGAKRAAAGAAHDEASGPRLPSGVSRPSTLHAADAGFVRLGQAIGSAARIAEAGIMSIGGRKQRGAEAGADELAAGAEPPGSRVEHDPLDWLDELPPDVRAVVEQELAHLQREERGQPQPREQAAPEPARVGRPPASGVGTGPAEPTPSAGASTPGRDAERAPRATQQRKTTAASPAVPRPHTGPSIDLDAWVARAAGGDTVRAVALRLAVDDWLRGSHEVRREAVQVLASVGPDAEQLFVGLLRGANASQAELALEALLQVGSGQFTPCMRAVSRDPDPSLRTSAFRVAQRLEGARADTLLEQASRDPSVEVRQRAVQWLSWRQEPWAHDRLWEMCDDEASEVRWAAVRAMIARDAPNMRWRVERAKATEPARGMLVSAMLSRSEAQAQSAAEPGERTEPQEAPAAKAELAARLVELSQTRASRRDTSMHQTEVGEQVGRTPESRGASAGEVPPGARKESPPDRAADVVSAGAGARAGRTERKGGSAGGES
jgi:hypothetical protein